MGELTTSGQGGLIGLLHGQGGEIAVPKPFERDIFLFDTHVAGTTFVEGIEDLAPHLNIDDKLDFFREPDNPHDSKAIDTHSFYSIEDFDAQLAVHRRASNNRPMRPLQL